MNPEKVRTSIVGRTTPIVLNNGLIKNIKYDFYAYELIESKFGGSGKLMKSISESVDGPIFTTVAFALWAGTDRKIPLQEFKGFIDTESLTEYVDLIATAFGYSFGVSVEDVEDEEKKVLTTGEVESQVVNQ